MMNQFIDIITCTPYEPLSDGEPVLSVVSEINYDHFIIMMVICNTFISDW